ncbi:hypothetical protein BG841_06295 [Marinobacter sp. X15-166B]|nr:hypothetical protein BG841_06295 [Marinobacter sp. X15-166B]
MDEGQYLDWFSAPGSAEKQVTLCLKNSPMVLLGYAANQYKQSTSRIFLKQFGVGSLDWRLMVVLYRNPNIPSKMVVNYLRVDKAAVSRTLSRLEQRGYVRWQPDANDERVKVWQLSAAGQKLHDDMLNVSVEIYQRVLSRLDGAQVDQFRQILEVLIESISSLPDELIDMPSPEWTTEHEK